VGGFALIPPLAPLPFVQERPFLLFDEINNKKKWGFYFPFLFLSRTKHKTNEKNGGDPGKVGGSPRYDDSQRDQSHNKNLLTRKKKEEERSAGGKGFVCVI
jgi:hypothetical protein